MKTQLAIWLGVLFILLLQGVTPAQYPEREDVLWARTAPAGSITMDGVLNEAAWSAAETITLNYGQPGLLPTSGWRPEFQPEAITDPTNATIKFLVTSDNQLWLGFDIPDSSIGGNQDWARWDAILMSIKDKLTLDPTINFAPPIEYFYTWWYINIPSYIVPGAPPRFVGKYGNFDDTTRTPEQINAWNAKTVVNGTSNDAGRDEGWTVEMRMDLGVIGYDVTQASGDIIMLNFSIWDCDFLFEGNPSTVNTTRTHFQSPWGNANANNVARIHARPDVTTTSGTLPDVEPDIVLPNNLSFADPVIDGVIDEEVWLGSYKFEMAWDDDVIKYSYPGVGPWMSGHFQPELGGNPRPPILDPSYGKIHMFFKNNYLYLAADIDDGRVQGFEEYDKIDGIRFMIGDRAVQNDDNNMIVRQMRISFDFAGQPAAYEFLQTLVDTGMAEYAVGLKGATTVNNNTDVDEGYQIELKIDLTGFGYPSGLGDKLIFMGADLFDGDSFDDPLNNYGSRTWWFREHEGGPALVWAYMDPTKPVGVEDEIVGIIPNSIEIHGNYPNPFNPSTKIKYSIPESGVVNVSVFNALGEVVESINLFNNAGLNEYNFNAANLSTGVYLYKISLESLSSGNNLQSKTGKMILLK
ncbi:MAG TPA: T9SS type A sorting domain-containing protein [Ignavibacteriaceae bacterium]|nr:T9SS type A sorting domain-containing protein [Ignavibacteriaceae bacterium]